MEGIEISGTNKVQGDEIGGVMGTEMCDDSEVQVNAGSNSTVFSGDSEVKVSQYSRVLRKRAN
jgi:hypothetical protein